MKKEWIYSDVGNDGPLVKRLLAARGIADEKEFLNPLETKLTSPNAFTDMEKCVERISKAIDDKEKILIHGDFDADGVTATSLLYRTFKHLGADVDYFIPEREKQGHGLDTKTLVKLMTSVKPKLIITVDCGISNAEAVSFLNSFKIDTIITDHHEAPEVLPEAFGIINPKAPNALDESLCAREINYLASLAGVGVAFKLAQALLNKEIPDNAACNDAKASTSSHFRNDVSFISEILPLVAVGTVADVVPLIGENRYFVAKGLDLIAQGKHYGLTRLLESAGYKPEKGITAENIAFGIAPRINASGRLETTEQAMKILISDNKAEIEMAVQSLNEFNKIRQELCRTTVMEAEAMLVNDRNPAIVLFNKDWHIGIIGIVASKLVEKYYKPAFLMTYSEETRQYRCSARSIEGIHLYDVLNANAELFDGFGGHAMAAGCSFTGSFDEVKAALNRTIKEISAGKELKPFINIDLDLSADEIDENLVAQISQLEPFGAGNPSPVFSVKNLKIKEKRLMGENKDHLRLTCIAGESLPPLTCVRWGQGDVGLVAGDTLDIAFHPQLNEYNGNTSVQLIIDDIHSDCLHEEEVSYKLKFYDHRKKTGILPQVEDYIKNSGQSIAIFAESKPVLDTLQPFKCLSRNIVTRDELKTCDSLMFFDYPADRDTFERILEQASPSAVHFMNYEIRTFDEKDFLKTVSGMLKFAHNSNGGKVELRRCASFLGKSYAVFELLFSIFEETGLISILEKAPDYYRIEYIGNIDLALVLHSEKYAVLLELIDECEQFQKSLMEEELETLI